MSCGALRFILPPSAFILASSFLGPNKNGRDVITTTARINKVDEVINNSFARQSDQRLFYFFVFQITV